MASGFKHNMPKLLRLLRMVPFLFIAAAVLWFILYGRHLTIDDVLHYSPEQPLFAALYVWLAFTIKSLSIFFPVMLLFAIGGMLFPLPIALLVNTVGITISLTLPYLIGRFSSKDLTPMLMKKYPKLAELRQAREKNGFQFAFLIRVIGVLPCDIVSMYLGNTRLSYVKYIIGGVLGFMPDLICATVAGGEVSDISSPWFWAAIGTNLVVCIASILFFRAYRQKLRRQAKT